MTGRRWIAYTPGVAGAFTWKVNVAFWPGATVASDCAATRLANGQFTPRAAQVTSSRLTPRRASWPSTPFTQVPVPVLANVMVSGAPVLPTDSVGYADCDTHREW